MITPNPKSHMSPKERARQIALEVQTMPGWSLNNPSFFAAFDYPGKNVLISKIHTAIKAHHFALGFTEQQWQIVTNNPVKFNQLWREALGLAPDTTPPPISFRSVIPRSHDLDLPFQSSIQLLINR